MTTTLDNLSGPSPLLEPDESSTADVLPSGTARSLWALTRLCLGWTFVWPCFDKLFGLGHETTSAKSWLNGGSPTTGFLKGPAGPFAGVYHHLAGSSWADWGFMLTLAVVGSGNTLGLGHWWTNTQLVRLHGWLT